MSQWFVKELADITGTSVQTLHHYDQIGLLKPSWRSAKGYRIYKEADLVRLQQIIALKFFGFELKQIKKLLTGISMREHFLTQAALLESKAQALFETTKALKKIINEFDDASLSWQSITNLIESYRMAEKLENTWVKEILTPEELKKYAQFEEGLKERFSPEEKERFHKDWAEKVADISSKLKDDPTSKSSMKLASQVMVLIKDLYGEQQNLRQTIWEKGFKAGHGHHHSMSEEMVKWLDAALFAYYAEQIYELLKQPLKIIEQKWAPLMNEMFGNKELEIDAITKMLNNPKISAEAKSWLKNRYKL